MRFAKSFPDALMLFLREALPIIYFYSFKTMTLWLDKRKLVFPEKQYPSSSGVMEILLDPVSQDTDIHGACAYSFRELRDPNF